MTKVVITPVPREENSVCNQCFLKVLSLQAKWEVCGSEAFCQTVSDFVRTNSLCNACQAEL
jgi:hypothetical protein